MKRYWTRLEGAFFTFYTIHHGNGKITNFSVTKCGIVSDEKQEAHRYINLEDEPCG